MKSKNVIYFFCSLGGIILLGILSLFIFFPWGWGLLFIAAFCPFFYWKRNKAIALGIMVGVVICVNLFVSYYKAYRYYSSFFVHELIGQGATVNGSDVICKVKVISGTDQLLPIQLFHFFVTERVAVVEVLENLKGNPPQRFVIKYLTNNGKTDPSGQFLSTNGVYVVFLQHNPDGFRLMNSSYPYLHCHGSNVESFEFKQCADFESKLLAERSCNDTR